MRNHAHRYKPLLSDPKFRRALWGTLGLFVLALFVNYFAALYAADRVSNYVQDIVLSNIPVFDVDAAFIFGPLVFWTVIGAILLLEPKKIPFAMKSVALFIIIRSVFITLTHIGPFPDRIPLDIHTMILNRWNLGNLLTFGSGGDLFFSGHTGLPFLMALIFWKDARMRAFCIIGAVFFGIVVLLGHLHYSIDVLSAFFITYTIYSIAEWLFKADRRLFYEESYSHPSDAPSAVK